VIVDSHCHLADEAFSGDRDAVLARAREAGVQTALCILAADDDAEIARAREEIVSRWPQVLFATAVHPHRAGAYEAAPGRAAELTRRVAGDIGAVALGEMGLDYHYDFAPRAVQQAVFAGQVALAVEQALPVIIHTREAADDTFAVLRDAGGGKVRGVMHCFTGTSEEARRALELGLFISFSGILTFPRANELRQVAALVPADRLLVETDAPYLAPVPHRGKRNEPAWVDHTLRCLAEVRRVAPDELAGQIVANFQAFIGRSSDSEDAGAGATRVDT